MARGEPAKTIGHARAGGETKLTIHCLGCCHRAVKTFEELKLWNDMMEWMPPPDGIAMCQGGNVCASHEWKRTSMDKVSIIGLDLAKRAFQAHGARADGGVAFRKKLSREKVLGFLGLRGPLSHNTR